MSERKILEAVDAATDSSHVSLGSQKHRDFAHDVVQLMTETPTASRVALPHLKKKIQSQSSEVQLLALFVLREVMQKCPFGVKQAVARPEFLSVLSRVLKRPNLKPSVREEILSIVGKWANDFARESDIFPAFAAIRAQLVAEGHKIAASPMANVYDEHYRRGVDKALKQRVDTIGTTAKSATAIMETLQQDGTPFAEHVPLRRIIEQLERDLKRIQMLIVEASSGDSMSILLDANDRVVQTLQMFNRPQGKPSPLGHPSSKRRENGQGVQQQSPIRGRGAPARGSRSAERSNGSSSSGSSSSRSERDSQLWRRRVSEGRGSGRRRQSSEWSESESSSSSSSCPSRRSVTERNASSGHSSSAESSTEPQSGRVTAQLRNADPEPQRMAPSPASRAFPASHVGSGQNVGFGPYWPRTPQNQQMQFQQQQHVNFRPSASFSSFPPPYTAGHNTAGQPEGIRAPPSRRGGMYQFW